MAFTKLELEAPIPLDTSRAYSSAVQHALQMGLDALETINHETILGVGKHNLVPIDSGYNPMTYSILDVVHADSALVLDRTSIITGPKGMFYAPHSNPTIKRMPDTWDAVAVIAPYRKYGHLEGNLALFGAVYAGDPGQIQKIYSAVSLCERMTSREVKFMNAYTGSNFAFNWIY